MASAFTHAFAAVAAGGMYAGRPRGLRFWSLAVVCSILPDADVVGFGFGVRYGDLLGHRGFTHSLFFAALAALLVVTLAFRDRPRFSRAWWGGWVFFFLITASHGFLDAMTNGGHGIAFLSPFSNHRWFLPWRPVEVSPISAADFFDERGLRVMASELMWVWLPVGVTWALVAGLRRRTVRGSQNSE